MSGLWSGGTKGFKCGEDVGDSGQCVGCLGQEMRYREFGDSGFVMSVAPKASSVAALVVSWKCE
ncbi:MULTISPECIES: hypothetical protein [Anaplasma]|uniref:hypothetical protein n=1 Tax=Anaplasma TaxID=768 RepID=UPI000316EF53|nr:MULTISPECIES: hypothetical protein [Anaplasma]